MKNLFLILVLIPFLAFAQEEKKEEALPPSGTLATAGDLGADVKSNEGPWGGINLQDDERPPLSANISKSSATEYTYNVINNSKDRYSGVIYLEQIDKDGRKIKSTPVSINLAAEGKLTRSIKVSPVTSQVVIQLSRWKSTPKKKSEEEIANEINSKKEELKQLETEITVANPTVIPTVEPVEEPTPARVRAKTKVF